MQKSVTIGTHDKRNGLDLEDIRSLVFSAQQAGLDGEAKITVRIGFRAQIQEITATGDAVEVTAPAAATNSWWTLSGQALNNMLERAHSGEAPGALLAEAYANSEVRDFGND